MNQLVLTGNTTKLMGEMFRNRFDILLSELSTQYPKAFESIVKEAIAQEAVKKFSFKGLFESFDKGGLFGRNGVFSFLGKSLFKKTPSTSLSPISPVGKGIGDETDNNISAESPLQPINKEIVNQKEKDFIQEEMAPIPIKFAGLTGEGKTELTEFLPPLFEDIFKNVFTSKEFINALGGIQPETPEDYGDGGLVGTALENLANLALAGSMFGGIGRGIKTLTGFGKKGPFGRILRGRRLKRLRTQRAARTSTQTGTPPVKPSVPVAPPVKPAATAAAAKGATTSAAGGAIKGGGRGAAAAAGRGALRSVPIAGTVLSAGLLASDLSSISEAEQKGEITQKEAYEQKGGAWGGAGGALAGASAGAALGTLILPGVGTVIGGIAGGILGGMGGQAGGEAIGGAMAPEEQPVVTPVPEVEMPNIDIPEAQDYTQTLNNIAGNTSSTSDKISRLSDAIFALAGTIGTQSNNQNTNFFINGEQKELPSASQIAASNFNAIGRIRQQFTV